MEHHVQVEMTHLKCDNPNCDYKQKVRIESVGAWVGALCPDCDAVLLTQDDYEMMQQLLLFVQGVNELADEIAEELGHLELGPRARLKISSDNEGNLEVGDIELEVH